MLVFEFEQTECGTNIHVHVHEKKAVVLYRARQAGNPRTAVSSLLALTNKEYA